MTNTIDIRSATVHDAGALADIYNYYIANTTITFEETALSESEMAARITAVTASKPWFVAVQNSVIVGYAYASQWKQRSAYRFAAETSIYVHKDYHKAGIGTALYTKLINSLASSGITVIIGGVAMPNEPSVRLHQKFGFKKVAQFEHVGFKMGTWIDVSYWEYFTRINS